MLSGMTAAQNRSQQSVGAQTPSVEQIARQKTDRQIKELSLDKDQADRLYRANLENVKAHRKMHDNKRDFEQKQRADMQKHEEQLRTSAAKILTPEQYAIWEASERSHKRDGSVKPAHRKGYQGKPMGCRGKCDSDKRHKPHRQGAQSGK